MALLNQKNIPILGIAAFLIISFWSLSPMSVDMNGKMINCPFMEDSSSFCQMNIIEHITQWQQSFVFTRERSLFLSLFALATLFPMVVFLGVKKNAEKVKHQQFRQYLYWHKPEVKLFDSLLLAFSQGILHPQIYA